LSPAKAAPSSAVDYVRSVLGETSQRSLFRSPAPTALPSGPATTPVRAQWERLAIAPDVELHVRRPLTREANRRVEQLISIARHIFEEEKK